MTSQEQFLQERFLRAKDLQARYGISHATLYRWTYAGKLPKPEFLNSQRVWRQSVIEKAEAKMLARPERSDIQLREAVA